MGKNLQGTRITGSISITGSITASAFIGDGSQLTGISAGSSTQSYPNFGTGDAVALGYTDAANSSTTLYKSMHPYSSSSGTSYAFNGEAITFCPFFLDPGTKITDLVVRVATAGSAGLGLAQAGLMIYRSQIIGNQIYAGALEKDFGTFSTLSTGVKILTVSTHTLSTNTYKNLWFLAMRNYQSGSLSLRVYNQASLFSNWLDFSTSTTIYKALSWVQTCAYTASNPTSLATQSGIAPTSTVATEVFQILSVGINGPTI